MKQYQDPYFFLPQQLPLQADAHSLPLMQTQGEAAHLVKCHLPEQYQLPSVFHL